MPERLLGFEPPFRIPREALGDKVNEEFVVAAQHLGERLGSRSPSSTLGVHNRSRNAARIYINVRQPPRARHKSSCLTEEELFARAAVDEVLVRDTENFHNA